MSFIVLLMILKIIKMIIFSIITFIICLIAKILFFDFLEKHFFINMVVTVIIPLIFIIYMILSLFLL